MPVSDTETVETCTGMMSVVGVDSSQYHGNLVARLGQAGPGWPLATLCIMATLPHIACTSPTLGHPRPGRSPPCIHQREIF